MLSRALESFTNTIDFEEVLHRIVDTTLEELGADRAWLISPVDLESETATVSCEAVRPGFDGTLLAGLPVPLAPWRPLMALILQRGRPVAVTEADHLLDPALERTFQIRSQLAQVLRPVGEHLWGLGLHQCSHARQWTEEEIDLFEEVGRYATLALTVALTHKRAMDEASRTRAILDQIPEAAAIYGPDGRLDRMNAAAQQEVSLLNISTPEQPLRAHGIRQLDGRVLNPDELPAMRALRGEQVNADFLTGDPRSGDERVVSIKGAPILDQKGKIIGSVVLSRDVTEDRQNQRAAEELASQEVEARTRFEAVLDTAPIGIAVVSADELRFELANPLWVDYAARFGKISSDTKLIGLRVAEVIPGLERELRSVAEKREMRVQEALEVRQGRQCWYMNQIISPVVGLSGQTQSVTILLQDVSEQVQANNEIEALAKLMEERSARLDSILGSMTDALWVYDASGKAIDVNPAALAMFGLGSRSEAVARGSLRDFKLRYPDGNSISEEDMPYARALRGEVVPDYLAVGRPLFASRDLDLSIAAAPIESGGVVGAVLVIRDISALQELDRKKDEFLSVASHELRTPLTTIKGYTQLLAQNMASIDSEDRDVYLASVLGEIDRMIGLISELLDVSRIETKRLQIHPSPIEWIEFLSRQAASFRIQNPDRVIIFKPAEREVFVDADVDRMRQVVDNLLSNALKYSPDTSAVEIRVIPHEGSVQTSVTDQGIGIPKDELPQLFERFHRARNVSSRYYGGLGLGLYIAKAMVEAHRGTISVESREGEGSTFTITLPRNESS
jgi:PAS domain S-box-containing protein